MLLAALLVLGISCNLLPLQCSSVTAQDRSGATPKRYHSGGGYGHKNNFKTELSLDPSKIVLRCRVKEPLEHIVWVVSRCPGHHGGGYGGHHDRLVAEGATVNDPSNYDVRIVGGNSTIISDLIIKKPLSAMGAGLYRCEAWPHGGGGPPYGYVAQEVYLIGGKELLKSCFGGWEAAPSDYSGGGFSTGYAKSKHRGGDSQYFPRYNMSGAASTTQEQHVSVSQVNPQESQQREAADPMNRLPIYPSRPMRFSSARPSSYQQPIRDRIDHDEELTMDDGELEEPNFERGHPYSFENSQPQRRHQLEQQAYNSPSEENNPREQHRFRVDYKNQNSKQEQQNSQAEQLQAFNSHSEQQQKKNSLREQHRFRGYANQNLKQQEQQTENVNRHRPQSQFIPKPANQPPNPEERRPAEQKVKPVLVFASSSQPTPATPTPKTQQAQSAELQSLIRQYHEYLKQQPTLTTTVVPPRSYVSLSAPHTQQRLITPERVVHNHPITESPLRPSPADPGTPPATWSQLVSRTSKSQEESVKSSATDEVSPPSWSKLAPRSDVSQKSTSDDGTATPAWSQLVARVQSRSSKAMYGAGHSGAVEHLTVDTAVTQPPQE